MVEWVLALSSPSDPFADNALGVWGAGIPSYGFADVCSPWLWSDLGTPPPLGRLFSFSFLPSLLCF